MLFDTIKNFFNNDIGIDLGTMNTLIYVKNKGIVLDEPSVVAINADRDKVRAVGSQAKAMMEITPENIRVVRPMRDGVIADAEVTDEMLRIFIRKATGKMKVMRPRVLVAVPSGITEVGLRAVRESALSAGARKVQLVQEPFAAAIGSGLPVNDPDGNMIIDIGGGTTEVALICLGSIVVCSSVQCAGDAMDAAIVSHLQNVHHLLIGDPTAERIKIAIGSAYPLDEPMTMEVKGLDMAQHGNRLPRAVIINSEEIRQALERPISQIIQTVRHTIDASPPELSARLIDNGITLAGGGSQLRGLDKLISEETGLAVRLGKDPLQAVVNGTGLMLEHANQLFSQPTNSLIGKGRRV
ncbi:MAG: rod shape-determining protein [Lentisphaerae bacterium]|nr:rod shape-determining protein [Lentisphaerota bacterium]